MDVKSAVLLIWLYIELAIVVAKSGELTMEWLVYASYIYLGKYIVFRAESVKILGNIHVVIICMLSPTESYYKLEAHGISS